MIRATEANKDLVRRYFDALERGALDEATELWATEATNHASGRTGQESTRGRDAVDMVHRMLRAAFPDRRYQIEAMIAEGDQVDCRMTMSSRRRVRVDFLAGLHNRHVPARSRNGDDR
jgi:ketosteroid isomerase-like protein